MCAMNTNTTCGGGSSCPKARSSFREWSVTRRTSWSIRDSSPNAFAASLSGWARNVMAGTDCGLGGRVHPQLAWAKLKILAEGAKLASQRMEAFV